MGRQIQRKTRSYAEFARIIDEIIDLGYKNCNNVTNICSTVGYSNGVSTPWRLSGEAPEVALWAAKGLLAQIGESKVGFTQEEIRRVMTLALDANDKKLAVKCMDLWK